MQDHVDPFKYLGLEVGGNPRKKQFWEPVINKINARLSIWKGRFLSMAGRVCLLKSVFTAIPLFYLSFFKAPILVCNRIISIQRKFLWAWGRDNRSISWVRWENVCKPLEEGGLGIKDVRNINNALLTKWKWRLMNDEKGKWKDILVSRYGSEIGRSQTRLKWQSCGEGEDDDWFQKTIVWKVGDGGNVRFWEDAWVNNNNLKSLYPRLYSLSMDQRMKVGEVGTWEGYGWQWRLNWRKARFKWESSLEEELLMHINRSVMNKESKDSIV